MKKYDVCIIGAGAAGMTAAIYAAQRGKRVVIIDKNKKCGTKLYATGNGRCNLANTYLDENCYYGAAEVLQLLPEEPCGFVSRMMEELGVPVYEKNGYLYPVSNQASTVVWALSDRLKALGVEVILKQEIMDLQADLGGYTAFNAEGDALLWAKNIILAVGSPAAPQLGAAGIGATERLFSSVSADYRSFCPALCPLKCQGDFTQITGVRGKAVGYLLQLTPDGETAEIDREQGELQITDYGVSGIMIFNLAGGIAQNPPETNQVYKLRLDLIPDYSREDLLSVFRSLQQRGPKRTITAFLNGYLPDRLAIYFIQKFQRESGSDIESRTPLAEIGLQDLEGLLALVKGWDLQIEGLLDYDRAQAASGGIPLSGLNLKTLELKNRKGIYCVGEAADVVGRCGGYNLMWAFYSGALAGESVES